MTPSRAGGGHFSLTSSSSPSAYADVMMRDSCGKSRTRPPSRQWTSPVAAPHPGSGQDTSVARRMAAALYRSATSPGVALLNSPSGGGGRPLGGRPPVGHRVPVRRHGPRRCGRGGQRPREVNRSPVLPGQPVWMSTLVTVVTDRDIGQEGDWSGARHMSELLHGRGLVVSVVGRGLYVR